MKRILFLLLLFLASASSASATVSFGSGYYTNLCGTGTAATANTCNKGCNPATGSCTSDKSYVIKWTCSGNLTECRQNESGFATSQNIGATTCGQTVLMQVYNRNCRSYFGWICSDANLLDSMTWYSGDCQGQQQISPSLTPSAGVASSGTCEELTISKGNNTTIPAAVTFQVKPSSSGTGTYKYYFGDGTSIESSSPTESHTYAVSGVFTARVELKNSSGIWTGSPRCETPVAVKSSTLETQKSDCSDLFVIDGNNMPAPATVSLRVTGYDNKGLIKKYKITSSDSQMLENESGAFQMKFAKAGTYTIQGSITDSLNISKNGSSGSCVKTVSVATQPLQSQPNTGTPTWYSLMAISSGVLGVIVLISARLPRKVTKARKHRSS